jgi:putative hydrolase
MKFFADYHTHTKYSHGVGTIKDNVEAAIKKGLTEILISDHGPGHIFYGAKTHELKKMRDEIDELNKQYKGTIRILLGLEANLISADGDIDITHEDMKILDKLLVGFHKGAMPKTLKDGYKLYLRNYIVKYVPSLQQECRRLNTEAMVKAINKYNIDIITHPGEYIDIDTKELARAAAKKGTALEINASHGFLTVEYVKIAMKEGVNFVIDSDAHKPEDVGNFEKGIKVAEEAGLPIEKILNAVKY